jgi:hypothetical protein
MIGGPLQESQTCQVRGWLLWPGVTLMFVDSMVNLLITVSWKNLLPQSVMLKVCFWRTKAQREDRLSLLRESLVAEEKMNTPESEEVMNPAVEASNESLADIDAKLQQVQHLLLIVCVVERDFRAGAAVQRLR